VALVLAGALARPALAQNSSGARPERAVSPVVHYGKWGAALLFVGFTALGALEHAQANDAFDHLQDFCRTGASCAIGADGRYVNPVAESRYLQVVSSDRAARTWLVSGQIALGGAAALFVVELLRERGTRNIPFQGLTVTPARTGTRIGWTLHF
jgi:hypothetical protein